MSEWEIKLFHDRSLLLVNRYNYFYYFLGVTLLCMEINVNVGKLVFFSVLKKNCGEFFPS